MTEGKSFSERHEALKKRIHAFRVPLGPFGRFVMSCLYFSLPVVGGYFLMGAVEKQAKVNLENTIKHSIVDRTTKDQNQALQEILDKVTATEDESRK